MDGKVRHCGGCLTIFFMKGCAMKRFLKFALFVFVGGILAVACKSTYDSGNKNNPNAAAARKTKTKKTTQKQNASTNDNDWDLIL